MKHYGWQDRNGLANEAPVTAIDKTVERKAEQEKYYNERLMPLLKLLADDSFKLTPKKSVKEKGCFFFEDKSILNIFTDALLGFNNHLDRYFNESEFKALLAKKFCEDMGFEYKEGYTFKIYPFQPHWVWISHNSTTVLFN